MTIEDKISKIGEFTNIRFFGGKRPTLKYFLENNYINENQSTKLQALLTNFWGYANAFEELNSHSILFINLLYKIVEKNSKPL